MMVNIKKIVSFLLFCSSLLAAGEKERAKEVLMMLRVIEQEYQLAFEDEKMVNSDEYEESLAFVKDAYRKAEALNIQPLLLPIYKGIQSKLPPEKLKPNFSNARQSIQQKFNVEATVIFPPKPDLAKGKKIYMKQCASCHGQEGFGDGPAGRGLDPPPRNFHDPSFLSGLTKQDIFNVVSVGIPKTAMPAFRKLSEEERILVSSYVFALAGGEAKEAIRKWQDLKRALREIERKQEQFSPEEIARELRQIYLQFEYIEPELGAKDPKLLARAEDLFGKAGDPSFLKKDQGVLAELIALVPQIDRVLSKENEAKALAMQSFVILLREGFEIILLLSLLLSLIQKSGLKLFSSVYGGSIAAIVASLFFAYGTTFFASVASREILEGIAHLLAAAILFAVSFYFISQKETQKWLALVKSLAQRATKSIYAKTMLFAVAFLVVLREGVETVLFYQALYLSAPSQSSSLLGGAASALLFLLVLAYLIFKVGVKLPLKPFFAVSGLLLQIMCISFAGKGIHALQEAGVLSNHYGFSFWQMPVFGMYPSYEVFFAQVFLIAVALAGWLLEQRRLLRQHH